MRTRPIPGTDPSGRASPASATTPVAVPIVSKKSVSMIVKMTRRAVRTPELLERLGQVELAEGREAGGRRDRRRDRLDPGRDRDDRRDQDAQDERRPDLQDVQPDRDRQPEQEDEVGGGRGIDRHDRRDAALGRHDHPAVDEADEQDEQADAHPDRPLERERHGVHDRLPGADHHEHGDHEALPDDDAHRARQGQAAAQDQPEGDDPVDPEAGGDRQRVVADETHRDRHDPGHERGRGGGRRDVDPGGVRMAGFRKMM